MEVEKILKALRHLKVETGSLACLGCGHENGCSTKGCAVIRAAIEMLEQLHDHEPVTPEEAERMGYAKVWIDYGEEGEWGIIVNGKLYATDTLEGAGFGELLEETVRGEMLDNPTGDYKIYRSALRAQANWEECDWVEPDCHGFGTVRIPNAGLRCTRCVHVFKRDLLWRSNFCPNCGARMRKENGK